MTPHHGCVFLALTKGRRLFDLLHIVHLGTFRDIIPSCLIDALDDGTLAKFLWDARFFRQHDSFPDESTCTCVGSRSRFGPLHWNLDFAKAW